MDDATRALIRQLYFVARQPVRAIGESLALAPHAVRAALVLTGGERDGRAPSPSTATGATERRPASPWPPLAIAPTPARRRRATRTHL